MAFLGLGTREGKPYQESKSQIEKSLKVVKESLRIKHQDEEACLQTGEQGAEREQRHLSKPENRVKGFESRE